MSNETDTSNGKCVSIFQINLGKLRDTQNELINQKLSDQYDIILVQEPYVHHLVIYPPHQTSAPLFQKPEETLRKDQSDQ